jgi:hypothetical protein
MKLSNQTRISIVSGACLLILVIALKNILNVPAETLTRDIVLYIFIYGLFGVLPSLKEEQKYDNVKYWYLAIIITTLAIIGLYAL